MPRLDPAPEPITIERPLPPFRLEAGAALLDPRARVLFWGTVAEHDVLREGGTLADDPDRPILCVLHTLTGALDPRTSFPRLFGRGRPFRPWACRIVAVGLLGSHNDPAGPSSGTFPNRTEDLRHRPSPPVSRGGSPHDERRLPATVTTWDQARAVTFALHALGLHRVRLVLGASLGGMVALALAAYQGDAIERACAIASPLATSAWTLAHDHLVREILLSDPDFPHGEGTRALARQVAFFGYRGRRALVERQGRETSGPRHAGAVPWSPRAPYRVETYFRHIAEGPHPDPRDTVAMLGAMDHHDLARRPPFWPGREGDAPLDRVSAHVTCVGISSDTFVTKEEVEAVAHALGARATYREITSDFGHDGFLVEEARVAAIAREAFGDMPTPAHPNRR
ncbi:MAG: alpha/beta fold hydrolase [Myxococcales bacterium]|nr:alpha/beta fold hydrolase [Myxococcales bacterium]